MAKYNQVILPYSPCDWQNNGRAHTLTRWMYILQGKGDYTCVTELRTLRYEVFLDYPDGPNLITGVHEHGKPIQCVLR